MNLNGRIYASKKLERQEKNAEILKDKLSFIPRERSKLKGMDKNFRKDEFRRALQDLMF